MRLSPTRNESLLLLAFLSIGLMLILAIPLGIIAAIRRGKVADMVVSLISYAGVALPEFVTATLQSSSSPTG